MNSKLFAVVVLMAIVATLFIQSGDCSVTKDEVARVKRGHHGGGGHGHGPGSGGGAAGPVYFCGWVGKTEGSRGGYGHGK